VEKGHYIDADGNNFWGVQVFQKDGQEYVAASDRDHGLWIFQSNGTVRAAEWAIQQPAKPSVGGLVESLRVGGVILTPGPR
jgi:hypothetical protein